MLHPTHTKILGLFLFFFLSMSSSLCIAKELKGKSEDLANKYFYRQDLIKLLYDNDLEYKKLFNCQSVMLEKPNDKGGIDTACVTETDILWISISIGPRRRPSSVYVCPTKRQDTVIEMLISLSYETNTTNNGIKYRMGKTNGWLKKFENVLFSYNAESGINVSCWDLIRR